VDDAFSAAVSLAGFLRARHWRESALIGPDPGIRFTYRIGRFVKSCLPALPWHDDYYYLQGQGYWVLANWRLFAVLGEPVYRQVALVCSRQMLARQRPDGAWTYPHVEWSGRIATVEGIWASLGLLESYRQSGEPELLDGARRWHAFLDSTIGHQHVGGGLAVNYFAGRSGDAVPNNSACTLRFLAELAAASGDPSCLEPCAGMVAFLAAVQKPSGELPYAVPGADSGRGRSHFQCYQYNAFQCLDLLRYAELTGDRTAEPILRGLLRFLRTGLERDGHAAYACDNRHGAVTYHAAVLGLALLSAAGGLGEPDDAERGRRALSYVLRQQGHDGGFPHSRGDYRLLRDDRPYPRYLAMIAYHLLVADGLTAPAKAPLLSVGTR
jgi:hypothetical protein